MKKKRLVALILSIMRITFVQLLLAAIFSFSVFAKETAAQAVLDRTISISVENSSIKKVIAQIEQQTQVKFVYSSKAINAGRKISYNAIGEKMSDFLNSKLKSLGIGFKVVNEQVLLYSLLEEEERVDAAAEAMDEDIPLDIAINISGAVTNEKGEPLEGVTVLLKGSQKGTATDAKGNFKIAVDNISGATLVFSIIGYEDKEIALDKNNTILKVTLKASSSDLKNVVVIGYGTVTKKDLTGSVAQIRAKEINAYPTTNIMQAMQGKSPGVQVLQNNGAPGGSISVRIRGTNSILGSNEPLYVIDGFPYSGNPTFLQNADIESIEILKDASSIAIYGSRGANGVVIITTRSGIKKRKTTVDFSTGYTVQSVSKKMKLMNAIQYAELYNEQGANNGLNPYFTQGQLDTIAKGPSTDWQDLVMQHAPLSSTNLTISGGNEKTQFALSGGAFLQDGIIRNSNYNRYSLRANINHEISKVFSVTYNATLTHINARWQNSGLSSRGQDLISGMLMAPPTLGPYLADGSYRRLNTAYPFISNVIINPLVKIYEVSDRIKTDRVFTNAAFTIKPFKDLSIRISGGLENSNDRTDTYSNIEPSTNSVGSASIGTTQLTSLLNENIANYTKKIGKHTIAVLGGFTYQNNITTTVGGSGAGFLSDVTETSNLQGAATPGIPTSGYTKWALLSYLARLNYNFDDRYLLTFSFRRDGSSRYSEDNKWGSFPSAAFAWRISNEKFMQHINFISDLKLRTSYGETGSTAIDPYQTLTQLSSSKTVFGDVLYTAFAPGTVLPGNLKWETTAQFDAGIDAAILDSRIRFTADYYIKKTRNLLNNVQLPASTGYVSTVKNVGEIQNKGFELGLEADIIRAAVRWNVSANISFNRNKVIKLYEGQDILGSSIYTGPLNDYVNLLREGQPLGIFYGYKEKGYTATGNIEYQDLNKDGTISSADKTYIGNPNPKFIYGFNSSTAYKGVELSVFIQGSQGNDIFNLNKAQTLDMGMGLNMPQDVYYDHWTPEKTNAKYPKISNNISANMSNRFVEDGSYIRLKNIELSYSIPVDKLNAGWFRSAQVYVSAQNLVTITRYSWYDPDINAYGGGNSIMQGIDYYTYPTSKSVSFGIRCGF